MLMIAFIKHPILSSWVFLMCNKKNLVRIRNEENCLNKFHCPADFRRAAKSSLIIQNIFFVEAKLNDLLIERSATNPKAFCHSIHATLMRCQSFGDELSFKSGHGFAQCVGDVLLSVFT